MSIGVERRHKRQGHVDVTATLFHHSHGFLYCLHHTLSETVGLWIFWGAGYVMETPDSVANLLKSLPLYCGPLSETTFLGIPCSLKICFMSVMTLLLVECPGMCRTKGISEK